jgi:putative phosphoribosyl transferase
MARFADRFAAGRELGALVAARDVERPVVLALPRGGVPVAVEVARALAAPLDVLVVRKLRVPWQPELAFGAVASGDVRWLNDAVARRLPPQVVADSVAAELDAVHEYVQRYRPGREPLDVHNRNVVLVDDGIATGASVHAAVQATRLLGAKAVLVAAPIAPPDVVRELERVADRVDVVEIRRAFGAVSVLYDDFTQVDDATVAALLAG